MIMNEQTFQAKDFKLCRPKWPHTLNDRPQRSSASTSTLCKKVKVTNCTMLPRNSMKLTTFVKINK